LLLLKRLELRGGAVQIFVRDTAGNMVEVNWPDVSTLDRSMIGDIEKDDAGDEEATLYLGKR
jgi:hypothetical protein